LEQAESPNFARVFYAFSAYYVKRMAYFPDLSRPFPSRKVFAVGWLDECHPFLTAAPRKWMIEKLWTHCYYLFNHAGGFHECTLTACPGPFKKSKIVDFGRKRPSVRKIRERYDSLRAELQSGPFTRLSEGLKGQLLASLDHNLKIALRGYSRMVVGVHPDSGQRIYLGHAEIWIFGKHGRVYKAPNMLYHYVTVHNYQPPEEKTKHQRFVRAT